MDNSFIEPRGNYLATVQDRAFRVDAPRWFPDRAVCQYVFFIVVVVQDIEQVHFPRRKLIREVHINGELVGQGGFMHKLALKWNHFQTPLNSLVNFSTPFR